MDIALVIEGRIFVIRPSEPVNISRLEKNVAKLNDLYQKGTADAHASFYGLQKFLGL